MRERKGEGQRKNEDREVYVLNLRCNGIPVFEFRFSSFPISFKMNLSYIAILNAQYTLFYTVHRWVRKSVVQRFAQEFLNRFSGEPIDNRHLVGEQPEQVQ